MIELKLESECFATEVLDQAPEDCAGVDPVLSAIAGRLTCESCLKPCLDVLVEQNAEAQKTALIDPLTGLLNRRGLTGRFEHYRSNNIPIAVMFLDVEKFKQYNETELKHAGGDLVLRALGNACKTFLRAGDTIARIDDADIDGARYGGDEIVIIGRLDNPDKGSEEISQPNRRQINDLTVYERAKLFEERFCRDFGTIFRESMEEQQADIDEGLRLPTDIGFHMGIEVSDIFDNRTLEELLHKADPPKHSSKKY